MMHQTRKRLSAVLCPLTVIMSFGLQGTGLQVHFSTANYSTVWIWPTTWRKVVLTHDYEVIVHQCAGIHLTGSTWGFALLDSCTICHRRGTREASGSYSERGRASNQRPGLQRRVITWTVTHVLKPWAHLKTRLHGVFPWQNVVRESTSHSVVNAQTKPSNRN